jgi:hypothetical protein
MLYHEIPKNVNQLFAMIVNKKIDKFTYQVTSRNYFKLTDTFEVLAKSLERIEIITIKSIHNENNLPIDIVNTPMSKLTIKIDKDLNLFPNDMIRIKK